jgi:hypothetical protein
MLPVVAGTSAESAASAATIALAMPVGSVEAAFAVAAELATTADTIGTTLPDFVLEPLHLLTRHS